MFQRFERTTFQNLKTPWTRRDLEHIFGYFSSRCRGLSHVAPFLSVFSDLGLSIFFFSQISLFGFPVFFIIKATKIQI